MPFGLCNAGGTFQEVQTKVFEPFIGKFIRVYLDDFEIYGTRMNHIQHVQVAFQRLSKFQCSLSPERCCLGFEKEALLGHVVFQRGIKVDLGKVRKF